MEVKSKMPGKILEIKVNEGDSVKKGDVIAVIEAMKMKNPVPSPADGTVKEVKLAAGDRVNAGGLIMVIE